MLTCVESDQTKETWISRPLGDIATAMLLSVRSEEAQGQGLPCQDYARVLSNEAGSSISFCVCDGVGSSYYGGFAARYLATHLVEWLDGLDEIPASPVGVSSRLQQWAMEGQEALIRLVLPSETPVMLRSFLEELRDTHGSQAVFFCGRVDYPHPADALETPVPAVRALFYWMGNVTARIFARSVHYQHLGKADNDKNRWSTTRGPQGKVGARALTLETLDRILIYTDGLSASGAEDRLLNDPDTQAYTRDLLTQPASDDMTVLELRWEASSTSESPTEKASNHE